jgi:hypothetical protein
MNTIRKVGLVALALILCAALFAGCRCNSAHAALPTMLGLTALGAIGFLMKDALLKVTRALPAAAGATVNSTGIDLQEGTRGDFLADCEVLVSAPALTTTMAPDTRTMTYNIQHDTDSAFGTAVTIASGLIVQTGAGGVGAAATTARFRLPTNVKQFIRLQIVSGASTTDSSAVSATMELLF